MRRPKQVQRLAELKRSVDPKIRPAFRGKAGQIRSENFECWRSKFRNCGTSLSLWCGFSRCNTCFARKMALHGVPFSWSHVLPASFYFSPVSQNNYEWAHGDSCSLQEHHSCRFKIAAQEALTLTLILNFATFQMI